MEPPRSYPYRASPRAAWVFMAIMATCGTYAVYEVLIGESRIWGIEVGVGWAGSISLVMAGISWAFVLLIITALILQRKRPVPVLEIGEDAMVLPHGLLQRKLSRIPYSGITKVWEQELQGQRFCHFKTPHGKFVVTCALMPDPAAYEEVKAFLHSQVGAV